MEQVNIINLTPHDVVIHTDLGNPGIHTHLCIKPEPNALRAYGHTRVVGKVMMDGQVVNITKTDYVVDELPPAIPGTLYIVSRIVAEKFMGVRDDLVIPTGLIRDNNEKIIGCKSLAKL